MLGRIHFLASGLATGVGHQSLEGCSRSQMKHGRYNIIENFLAGGLGVVGDWDCPDTSFFS